MLNGMMSGARSADAQISLNMLVLVYLLLVKVLLVDRL